jgi:hypothetical protein
MSELPNLVELRRLFAQSGDARVLDASSGDLTAQDTKLGELLLPVLSALRELVEWVVLHEPEGDIGITITWYERLVMVEIRDVGSDLPRPESVRADAEWAARLLAPPSSEWGAETDHDGRRLWVALSTQRQRPDVMHS